MSDKLGSLNDSVRSDTPCPKCGGIIRYKYRNRCVPCTLKINKSYRRKHKPDLKKKSAQKYLKTKTKVIERSKKWAIENPEMVKLIKQKHKRKSGKWAPGEHERALSQRPFVKNCACCGSDSPRHKSGWRADHNHDTGFFRAYICHPCNVVIGFMEVYSLGLSSQVFEYLKRYDRSFKEAGI